MDWWTFHHILTDAFMILCYFHLVPKMNMSFNKWNLMEYDEYCLMGMTVIQMSETALYEQVGVI